MAGFGETIRAARELARLTQAELAKKAGLSQTAISKAEAANTADDAGKPETVERILAALGMQPADFSPDPQTVNDEGEVLSPRATHPPSFMDRHIRAKEKVGVIETRFPAKERVDALLTKGLNSKVHSGRDVATLMNWFEREDLQLPAHTEDELITACGLMLDAAEELRFWHLKTTHSGLFIALAIVAARKLMKSKFDPRAEYEAALQDYSAVPVADDEALPF